MAPAQVIKEKSANYTAINVVKEDPADYNKHKPVKKENKKVKLLKSVPLDRLMDLKIDYAFKQFFGSEKNKDITVVFLNAILQKTGRNRIKDISFTNTESGGEYAQDKQSRLDLLVVTDVDEWVNVEIQFTNKYDMINRSIYYWAGAYRGPFQKTMTYKELRPVIAINILNFNLFNQTDRFHTTYHLYEDKEKFKLTDVMEFHFIEMSKLIKDWKDDKLDPWNDALARWLLMLGMIDRRNGKVYEEIYRELEEISLKDETLKNAFQNWEELSRTHEQYLAYESRLKRIMDEEAAQREAELLVEEAEHRVKEAEHRVKEAEHQVKEAEHQVKEAELQAKEAINEGRKEGEAKGVEKAKETIARRLLAKGMEIEVVAESADMTREKVVEIFKDMKKPE